MENTIMNHYVSNENLEFKLLRKPEIKHGRKRHLGNVNDETLSEIMPVGFADGWKINNIYLTVLRNLKIDQINNEEIVTRLYSLHHDGNSGHITNTKNSESSMSISNNRFEDYNQIIRLRINKNWNICSLCSKFGLTKVELISLFNESQSNHFLD